MNGIFYGVWQGWVVLPPELKPRTMGGLTRR